MTLERRAEQVKPVRRFFAAAAGVGALTFLLGLLTDPADAWSGYLAGFLWFAGTAVMGPFFLALLRLSGARWSRPFEPFLRATARLLPYVPAFAVGLVFGASQLYPWAGGGAAAAGRGAGHGAGHEDGWLGLGFFAFRAVAVSCVWLAAGRRFLAADAAGDRGATLRRAAAFVALFAFTFSVAAHDWLKSLTPHWVSTIFALDVAAGAVLGGIAATILGVAVATRGGVAAFRPGVDAWNDVGKLALSFTLFWAYVAYCQYGLIWYANLPEETPRYLARREGGFDALVVLNVFLNWVAPFAVLLARRARSSPTVLVRVAIVLLAGRALDLWLHVAPAAAPSSVLPGLGALGAAVAFGSFAVRLLIDAVATEESAATAAAPVRPPHGVVAAAG